MKNLKKFIYVVFLISCFLVLSCSDSLCYVCGGDGKCPNCGGNSWIEINGETSICNYCDGTGKCPNCEGKGWIIPSNTEQPDY